MNTLRHRQGSPDDFLAPADTSSNRRVLLAWHRVIGCRVAVAFAAMIVLGAPIIGFVKGIPAAFVVAGFGAILLCGTIALLRQANRQFAAR